MSEEINNAKLAEKAHEEQMKIKEEAESSKVIPLTALSKTVTIREDTDQEYQLKLQFLELKKQLKFWKIPVTRLAQLIVRNC